MPSPKIHYISFDRFPAAKGASVHIDAFVSALFNKYQSIKLTTIKGSDSLKSNLYSTYHFSDSIPNPSIANEFQNRIFHQGLTVEGKNTIQRVLDFRNQLFRNFNPCPVTHVRSIFEGYPVAKIIDSKFQALTNWRPRLVYEVNGFPSIELKYHYPQVADDKELLRKLRFQENFCLEKADLILTVSQVNAEHIACRGVSWDKIRIIPNGVATSIFTYEKPIKHTSTWRVLYVGTLAAWQGIRVALEAIALLKRDYPNLHLTVVGDARNRQKRDLLKLAEKLNIVENLTIEPPKPQSELTRYYHQSHCVLAPLLACDRNRVQGCCPLKVLEAMACGTPMVASDLAVVRELVCNENEAILVKPGNPKSLKDGMLKLIRDPNLRNRVSFAARRKVKTQFTWEHSQRRLLDCYDDFFPNLASFAELPSNDRTEFQR